MNNSQTAKTKRRWWIIIPVTLITIVLLIFLSAYLWLRQSLPQLEGQITTSGVAESVTVTRDADGVPTIQAINRADASYALGYLHAQERFFQMDLLRRAGAGELSEILGEGTIGVDTQRRRHRFRHRAELALQNLTDREFIEASAYTTGVNDGLNALGSTPFEYTLLDAEPEPWSNADSMLVIYAMYFDLQDEDGQYERNYSMLSDILGPGYAEFMVPFGTSWDAPLDGGKVPEAPFPEKLPFSNIHEGQATFPPVDKPVLGSNNWVVGGDLTSTGAAIVANDMHLGLNVPNIWYRARLLIEANDTDVTGVTLPGVPAVVVGSNTYIAWGFTNSQTDTQDIVYIDWLDEEAGVYQTPDGAAVIESVTEHICSLRTGCSELVVRESIWGPLLESKNHADRSMATRWVAHDIDGVNMQLMKMENARTIEAAFEIAHLAGTPTQNMVVGDRDGNIGYTLLGPVPARYGPHGLYPGSWADGARGWAGRLAPPYLPEIINPPDARLWSANARMVSGELLDNVGYGNYALAGRQHQIRKRLMALETANEDDLLAIQLDDEGLFLQRWHDLMLEEFADQSDPATLATLEQVKNWQGRAVPDSIGYRVIRRFRGFVTKRVFAGLTSPLETYLGDQYPWYPRTAEGPVWRLITAKPDQLLPPGYDDWDALLAASMDDVLREIDESGGLNAYTWGDYSELKIDHPLSPFVPGLGWLVNTPHEQTPGEFANMPRIGAGNIGASERMVVSPGYEENGIFEMPSGQSGHPLSSYFNKGHENWVHGRRSPFLPGTPKWTLLFLPASG